MSLEDRSVWRSKQNQHIMAMQPEQKSSYPCRQRNAQPNINNIHDGSKQLPCIAYNNRMGDDFPVCAKLCLQDSIFVNTKLIPLPPFQLNMNIYKSNLVLMHLSTASIQAITINVMEVNLFI